MAVRMQQHGGKSSCTAIPSDRSANAQHKLQLKVRLGQALGLKP